MAKHRSRLIHSAEAYAMEHVTRVLARDDFHLELMFDTGELKVFDAMPYLDKGVFNELETPVYSSRPMYAAEPSVGRRTWILPRKRSTTDRLEFRWTGNSLSSTNRLPYYRAAAIVCAQS